MKDRIEALLKEAGAKPEAARIQHMKRFLSADLTRREIELLRALSGDLRIERVWRNAVKRALLYQSAHTVQARPAPRVESQSEQTLLGADQQRGRGIGGVSAPGHFSLSLGMISTRLHGRVRRSSWGPISESHAVAQAPDDPGTQKT